MRRFAPCCLAALLGLPSPAQWAYPPTRRVEAVDTWFGKSYPDPYRWLEDLKAPEVEAWFKAQADLADGQLARIPGRDALAQEWLELDKIQPVAYRSMTFQNGRVFYKKTLGGENVGRLFYRQGWGGAEKLLFDPSTYKPGVATTINSMAVSFDGRRIVLGLTAKGAEWSELRVLDVDKGRLLADAIYPSYGALGWTLDNRSFFYDAGKTTDIKGLDIELNRKTRLHRLGAPTATDRDIFSNEANPELKITPKEMPMAAIDETCPGYLIGNVSTVQNENRVFYAPVSALGRAKLPWKSLCQPSDSLVRNMVFHKDAVYAVTYNGAPKYKVVRTSLAHPDWSRAETVVPECADSIQYLTRSRDYLFIVYSNGVTGRIVQYDQATGKQAEVALPGSGTVGAACLDIRSNRILVGLTSWTAPLTRYDYDPARRTLAKSIFNTAVAYPGFDALVSEEVEVPGLDGTPVPLSIIHRKDTPLDGSSSCILDGYGAYGMSYTPYFSTQWSVAKRGVVLAFAHVRGGSEKGEAWYKAGFKATKPNTWKDFIACADYLVKKGYTSPARLAGTGTSAGGILISRAITDRPDLFAAAVCNVGCANALRGEFSANGPVNTPEFGTVQDPAECLALAEMDGVSHVREGVAYPAVLGVGGWNDPRVPVWQPGKFLAALQNAAKPGAPMLMKVNYDNGHFTEEKLVTFKNFASQFAFMLWRTGHKDFQPLP